MAGERVLESLSNKLLDLDAKIRVSEQDTYDFIESKKNESTKKKTKSDIGRFIDWLSAEEETRAVETIPPTDLDMYISRYLLTVKNSKTGKELEPSTLKGIVSSIRRYLIEADYSIDLTTDRAFRHSRETLKAKTTDLREKGLGNKIKRADPFTNTEIQIMYEKGILGSESPQALIYTIWLNNTMHFGLRGRQEHSTMLWGDIELKNTADGTRFYCKPT
ncbi:uncharacterized protein KIAA1958-like [Ruditapes philippinarum]|uniref:uncharacterized protein KIAA1958-like n=1 Tax=Ruditapes philippinarum TaxID=129788 RepID=UPI00295B7F25|nr:uncharacterized protein KIAA1958-like [Ruditapes philippinarum]